MNPSRPCPATQVDLLLVGDGVMATHAIRPAFEQELDAGIDAVNNPIAVPAQLARQI
jgi:hypothetical protein